MLRPPAARCRPAAAARGPARAARGAPRRPTTGSGALELRGRGLPGRASRRLLVPPPAQPAESCSQQLPRAPSTWFSTTDPALPSLRTPPPRASSRSPSCALRGWAAGPPSPSAPPVVWEGRFQPGDRRATRLARPRSADTSCMPPPERPRPLPPPTPSPFVEFALYGAGAESGATALPGAGGRALGAKKGGGRRGGGLHHQQVRRCLWRGGTLGMGPGRGRPGHQVCPVSRVQASPCVTALTPAPPSPPGVQHGVERVQPQVGPGRCGALPTHTSPRVGAPPPGGLRTDRRFPVPLHTLSRPVPHPLATQKVQ
jgi:hypothetical protein